MSKMFELLQQAQRDQELLRLSGPSPTIHTRNLDVLQRAGMDQQLFDIPSMPEVVEADPEPPSDRDLAQ